MKRANRALRMKRQEHKREKKSIIEFQEEELPEDVQVIHPTTARGSWSSISKMLTTSFPSTNPKFPKTLFFQTQTALKQRQRRQWQQRKRK